MYISLTLPNAHQLMQYSLAAERQVPVHDRPDGGHDGIVPIMDPPVAQRYIRPLVPIPSPVPVKKIILTTAGTDNTFNQALCGLPLDVQNNTYNQQPLAGLVMGYI